MGQQEELAAVLKAPRQPPWSARGRPRGHHRHHAAGEPPEGGGRGNAGGATALGVAAAGPRRDEEPVVEGHAAGG